MLIQTVVINKITTFSGHSFFEFQLSSYHMNFTFTLNNTQESNKLISCKCVSIRISRV